MDQNKIIFRSAAKPFSQYTQRNDLAEGSKILLDTDLKIILLDHQNNFDGNIMSNAAKNFDILAS